MGVGRGVGVGWGGGGSGRRRYMRGQRVSRCSILKYNLTDIKEVQVHPTQKMQGLDSGKHLASNFGLQEI